MGRRRRARRGASVLQLHIAAAREPTDDNVLEAAAVEKRALGKDRVGATRGERERACKRSATRNARAARRTHR